MITIQPMDSSRKRAKHTRSRLGCGVCRARHVRCDQTRPACLRCTTTGRSCTGYSASPEVLKRKQRQLQLQTTGTLTASPLLSPAHDPQQPPHHSLFSHLFQHSTVPELAGEFADANDGWLRLVLQLRHRETCVRQMSFALAALQCSSQPQDDLAASSSSFSSASPSFASTSSLSSLVGGRSLRDVALAHYAAAVSALNAHIERSGWAALEVTLLCSVLCITFDWLRGNHDAALAHLQSGLNVISTWEQVWHPSRTEKWRRQTWGRSITAIGSPGGYLIRNVVRPRYAWLVMQAISVSGRDQPITPMAASAVPPPPPPPVPSPKWPSYSAQSPTPSAFSTFGGARDALCEILVQHFYPMQAATSRRTGGKAPSASTNRRRRLRLREMLRKWNLAFDGLILSQDLDTEKETVKRSATAKEPAIAILSMWREAISVMIETKEVKDEAAHDSYNATYARIVRLAEDVVENQKASSDIATATNKPAVAFTADMGLVPVLYYTALKCRHLPTRERALALLEEHPRREGIWDGLGAAAVAREVMRLEEGTRESGASAEKASGQKVQTLRVKFDVEGRQVLVGVKRQGNNEFDDDRLISW